MFDHKFDDIIRTLTLVSLIVKIGLPKPKIKICPVVSFTLIIKQEKYRLDFNLSKKHNYDYFDNVIRSFEK